MQPPIYLLLAAEILYRKLLQSTVPYRLNFFNVSVSLRDGNSFLIVAPVGMVLQPAIGGAQGGWLANGMVAVPDCALPQRSPACACLADVRCFQSSKHSHR